jgi:hypothetical protein
MNDLLFLLAALVWLLVGVEVVDRIHRDQVHRWAARGLWIALLLLLIWPLSALQVAMTRHRRRGATALPGTVQPRARWRSR